MKRARAGLCALLLAAPAWPVAATPPPEEAVLAELPFLDSGDPTRVYVDLGPSGGRPFPLLLDTGASQTTLTPRVARALGVSVRREKRTPYRHATRLGRDLQFRIDVRSSDTAGGRGGEYGLLGSDFLAAYVIEIDFRGRRVRFLDPQRYRVPEAGDTPGEVSLPLRLVSQRPHLEVTLNGAPLEVMLDTGASFGLLLGSEVAQVRGIEARTAMGLRAAGVRGEIQIAFAELPELRLGTLSFQQVPIAVAPRGLHQQGPANDSLLGMDLLATCLVRIDYPHRRLWLQRDPTSPPRFLAADYRLVRRSGALLYRSPSTVFAEVILPDGPAARLGLEPGDVLDGVDPRREGFDPAGPHERIAAGGPIRVRRLGEGDRFRLLTLSVEPE